MTLNTTDPGESLATEESLAVETKPNKHPVRNGILITLGVLVALLVLVELTGGSPVLIINGMLRHARNTRGERQPTQLNQLVDEAVRFIQHGLRARHLLLAIGSADRGIPGQRRCGQADLKL